MTPKVSVYIATSLDGFIARKTGEIDWLTGGESDEDYGYGSFMSTVDQIVMGRNTYEQVLTFDSWPYTRKVIVLTSRDFSIPTELEGTVETLDLPPHELLQFMEQRGVGHIYLDGGVTIQRFLSRGLVNEMTITTIPILIGGGLPLFGTIDKDIRLELLKSQSFRNGFVQNHYKVL